jgi:hypothetical protein
MKAEPSDEIVGREITLSTGAKVAVLQGPELTSLLRFTNAAGVITRLVISEEAARAMVALLVSDERHTWQWEVV